MRGVQNRFDPYSQVKNRVNQLRSIGHLVDKVEIIVMGGTFPAMPISYQEFFVQRCLDAITTKNSSSLEEAKKRAEGSEMKNVGITVETRPDWAKELHVDQMLTMGVTRVELGVQNIYDDVYELVERGHGVQDVVEATRILKDSGMKVAYHLMPGLPGSNFDRDLNAFQRIFRDEKFKPDMIKIYPCLVLRGTKIYEWWRKNEYTPYTTEKATQLILEVKKIVPPWVRIMRIQRDIPAYLIEAGVKRSNLRQLVQQKIEKKGVRCRCIRCREIGHQSLRYDMNIEIENIKTKIVKEEASEGTEVFISAEDLENEVLVGFLRLRIPSEMAHRDEVNADKTSIVRELHVYGPMVPVGRREDKAWQHRGYGSLLLREGERISRESYDLQKTVVTSALGTKRYYNQFGYKDDGPYVSKMLG
jgi:elongator complex protein 3